MAINPITYQPFRGTYEVDWSPLERIGQQLRRYQDEQDAAVLLQRLYDRSAPETAYAPQTAPAAAPARPRGIERGMLPPVPGYDLAGNPDVSPIGGAGPTAVAESVPLPRPRPPVPLEPPAPPALAKGDRLPVQIAGPSQQTIPGAIPPLSAALQPGPTGTIQPEPPPIEGPPPGQMIPGAAPVVPAAFQPAPEPAPSGGSVGLPIVAQGGDEDPALDRVMQVIRQKESSGRYDNVTTTRNRRGQLQHAIGAYGVMNFNVGPWTREVLGREMTPEEFRDNPAAQDAVARAKLGQYAGKYGYTGAAKAWFAGESGMNDPRRPDPLGTTVASYAADFNRRMGLPPEITAGASRPAEAGPAPMAFDQTSPAGQAAGRVMQSITGARGAPAQQEITSEELGALFRNPITRPLATAFLQKRLDPDTYNITAAEGNIIRQNKKTGAIDIIPLPGKPIVVGKKLYDPASKQWISPSDDAYPDDPPANYRWADPKDKSKGVVPIEGGPGMQLPAEVQGRLGMGEAFLGNLPGIKKAIEGGALGIDVAPGAHTAAVRAGVGPGAEVMRQIAAGADALLRMNTGTGMGIAEAEKYNRRYEVSPYDTKDQLLSKLRGLENDLHFMAQRQGTGHGGSPYAKIPRVFGPAYDAQGNPVSPGGQAAAAPVRITTDAEYNRLQSGTLFVGPDGKPRRKP